MWTNFNILRVLSDDLSNGSAQICSMLAIFVFLILSIMKQASQ